MNTRIIFTRKLEQEIPPTPRIAAWDSTWDIHTPCRRSPYYRRINPKVSDETNRQHAVTDVVGCIWEQVSVTNLGNGVHRHTLQRVNQTIAATGR